MDNVISVWISAILTFEIKLQCFVRNYRVMEVWRMGGSSLKNLQVKKYSALRYFWKSTFFWLSYTKCLKRFNRAGGILRNGWKKKEFNEYLTYFFLFHSFLFYMLNKPSELIQIQCLKCFYPIMLIPVGVAKVCVCMSLWNGFIL